MMDVKKRAGRPSNDLVYEKMVRMLKRKKGATVLQVMEKLGLPKRTVYHYLEKAKGQGHRVIKDGTTNGAPFCII
tara:strand:+ start:102 stop:326 length:225 start_codon:yes stop_codon:yes gene_type:complete